MGNVYVAEWNAYPGGIFRTLDVAVESLAIGAVHRGIDGYADYLAGFDRDIEPLVKLGVGGSRVEHHLYAIMTSDHMDWFAVYTQDIDVKAGYSPKVDTVLSSEMNAPSWALQQALYDFATDNFDDVDALSEKLYSDVWQMVENVRSETDDADAAMKVLANSGSVLMSDVGREMEMATGQNAEIYLETLPDRAVTAFRDIAVQAFPHAFEDEAPAP